jgi:hypothetical protein
MNDMNRNLAVDQVLEDTDPNVRLPLGAGQQLKASFPVQEE